MAFISLIGVSKSFGIKEILKNIDFSINDGERIAIIGRNGSGKSSLLKIICNELEVDSGERLSQNGISILYLPQNPVFDDGVSVKEAIELCIGELRDAHLELNSIANSLSENQELLDRYEALSSFISEHKAWNLDSRIEEILHKFQLKDLENRPIATLSGGEQKRVALSQLFFKKADILILDEPTNHLDVEMVDFLEQMLLGSKSTILFISHDRYFIQNVSTRIVELDDRSLRSFNGGYSDYLKKKEEILHSLHKEHQDLIKILKKEEEWLNRGVKARVKRNEGRKSRIMAMRDEAKKNPQIINKIRLELQRESKAFNRVEGEGKNNKKMLFECEKISKSIGNKRLFADLSLRILQRDKIAIIGKNGSGKSSLLNVLLGNSGIDSGKLKVGDIAIGYFDQHRKMLSDEKKIIEVFCPNGGDMVDVRGKSMHVFGYLKSFLFPKEFLDFKIANLSGGEKNRLALALLFTKKYDCLILDEPTNDLDIHTINILEEYLIGFDGAVIFVSHDRYFVDKLAHRLLVFEGDGEVIESHIMCSEYFDIKKEIMGLDEVFVEKKQIQKTKTKPKKLSYKESLLLESLPTKIQDLEKKIKDLELELSVPKMYEIRGISVIAKELQEARDSLELAIEEYLNLEQKREELLSDV